MTCVAHYCKSASGICAVDVHTEQVEFAIQLITPSLVSCVCSGHLAAARSVDEATGGDGRSPSSSDRASELNQLTQHMGTAAVHRRGLHLNLDDVLVTHNENDAGWCAKWPSFVQPAFDLIPCLVHDSLEISRVWDIQQAMRHTKLLLRCFLSEQCRSSLRIASTVIGLLSLSPLLAQSPIRTRPPRWWLGRLPSATALRASSDPAQPARKPAPIA